MTEVTPWVIEISAEEMPVSLKMRLEKPLVVGRIDKNGDIQPDLDLGPYGAEQAGVSRRHVSLHGDDRALYATDLNSGNGTFINGARLEADKPYLLKQEDELRLGRMKIDVRAIISPTQGSVSQRQEDLQLENRTYPGSGEPILIVEDDVEVANILSLIMNRAGYKPLITHDVIGAIRLFNQKRPSAVILDLMLPDLNGLEFCRYVRRDVERNSTPVIVVSAVKSRQNVAQALEAGADIFLGKPVSAQELQQVVSSIIHRRQGGADHLLTRHLPGTAPLQAIAPESRHDAAVLFIAGHSETPLTLTIKDPVSLGRSATSTNRTHIDLSRYSAIDFGVSRVHAYLHRKNDLLYIQDADSVNGTFLNGQPLKPNELTLIHNADEIRLGQLRMYLYFLADRHNEE
ncbi:MAG: FHA domain-containing protein [Anaerolineae bacterium]|nr:FHA domain-containing protein [Anaerolineae bacterium]